MNKKLLFAAMSLVAFTACTDSDFESQKVAEEVGSVKFKVLNNDDAFTRASMDGNSIVWNANDGDLFTLYHGAEVGAVTGYYNACYKAEEGEKVATLSTPTMIKEGGAIMVWPVDTTFRITTGSKLTLQIPAVLEKKDEKGKGGIENAIPYVSDLITILPYDPDKGTEHEGTRIGNKNTAGKDREYPVYMRPMASQLTLKADYVGDQMAAINKLADPEQTTDPIKPITLTSVVLQTSATTAFTTTLPVQFNDPGEVINGQWDNAHTGRAWTKVTAFNFGEGLVKSNTLTTKVIDGTEKCKFLFLPQANIEGDGVADAAIILNTYYGTVEVSAAKYTGEGEYAKAWYRYISEGTETVAGETKGPKITSGEFKDKYKTTANVAKGMQQTINFFSSYVNKKTGSVVKGEPQGTAVTRYVEVLLKYLDMSSLHIQDDQQLYDVVRVWNALKLGTVEVYLDGDKDSKAFTMSQKTITAINDINKNAGGKQFKVKPCSEDGEKCNKIVITGGDKIQDMAFIVKNGDQKADVVLQGNQTWKWDGTVMVAADDATGIKTIINQGTLENTGSKTLNILSSTDPETLSSIGLKIDVPGKWNISGNNTIINVQNNVENLGTVTIIKGAQYRQDKNTFTNSALTKEQRFIDDEEEAQRIGKVINNGVFATVNTGVINNYSLIEHADNDAKTYITHNQIDGTTFATPWAQGEKMMGMITLEYPNKDEDNISISAVDKPENMEGFVAVKVTSDNYKPTTLANDAVGEFVNYMIINSGIEEITNLSSQVKYVEINQPGTEIAWNLDPTKPRVAQYAGLIVLSDVNIKLGTTITATVTYLGKGATMYVAGKFNKEALHMPGDPVDADATVFTGYYGNTTANVTKNYVTF